MLKSHAIQLNPNKAALSYLARSAGVARFAYNWALNEWNNQYKLGLKPKENELRKLLNSKKKIEYPWMYEVSKCCPQQAIKDLGNAFKNFFRNPKQFKYPKFKKKNTDDSFYLDNISFRVDDKYIFLTSWICPECSTAHDRDINAAINLKNFGRKFYGDSTLSCVRSAC